VSTLLAFKKSKSPPAEKAFPCPVRTTAAVSFVSIAANTLPSSSPIFSVSAFNRKGSFRVIRRTLLFAELLVDVTKEDVVVENDFALVEIDLVEIIFAHEPPLLFKSFETRVKLNIFFLLSFFLSFFTLWLLDMQETLEMKI
jgi:hypothetical protein